MMKLEKQKFISINIWDDFYDDGHVPKGETQDTYAYVEGDGSDDEKLTEDVMEFLYNILIATPYLQGVDIKLAGDQVLFKNITHKALEETLDFLHEDEIVFGEYKLDIYSES